MRVLFAYHGDECLALEYLSGVLKRAGHTTRLVFDPALFAEQGNESWLGARLNCRKRLLDEARDFAPDLIAISVLTHISSWAESMARDLKAVTGAPVVVGGVHVSGAPDETMARPEYDYGIIGEGEYPLLALVDALESGSSLDAVPNLMHHVGDELVKNPLGPFPEITGLPWPDKDLFYDVSPHFRHGYILQTARGCPMRCTFCSEVFLSRLSDDGQKLAPNRKNNEYLRQRPVDDVIDELLTSRERFGFTHLRIYDDIFGWDRHWFEEFTEKYAEKVRVPYWCFVYPTLVNEKFVQQLVASGCYDVQMGIQSLSPSLRRSVMHRGESTDQVARAIRAFHGTPITLTVDNIIGVPGQTPDELVETARFYSMHRPDRVNAYWLVDLPGTGIIALAKEQIDTMVSEGEAEEAERAEEQTRLAQPSEAIDDAARNRHLSKIQAFLYLVPILPESVNETVIRHRLYRMLPSPPLTSVMVRAIYYVLGKSNRIRHTEGRLARKNLVYLRRRVRDGLGRWLGRSQPAARPVAVPS